MRRKLRKPSKRMREMLKAALHQDWRRKRAKAQGGLCYWCQRPMKTQTLDHLVPLSKGGADHWENVVAACGKCNTAKGDMLPEEFSASPLSHTAPASIPGAKASSDAVASPNHPVPS